MRWRTQIRVVASVVVALGAASELPSMTPERVLTMCGSSEFCAPCCYGDDPEGCCLGVGCTHYCELETSGCCPGGYLVVQCS